MLRLSKRAPSSKQRRMGGLRPSGASPSSWLPFPLSNPNPFASRFKLHIRPREGASSSEVASKIPPLPLNKSVVDVLADYLEYLFKCAKSYICDTHANGPDLWDSVKNDIEFVLSHPNGWEGYQQTQIRQAVVKAKLIREGQGDRVSFISEGEASLWFALKHGLPQGTMEVSPHHIFSFESTRAYGLMSIFSLQRGEGVVIVDAGGGTIDISTYQKPVGSTKFEEISAPKCTSSWGLLTPGRPTHTTLTGHFYGSIFVSIHARLFFSSLYTSLCRLLRHDLTFRTPHR